jgi:UDP-glucose 4-epimerase
VTIYGTDYATSDGTCLRDFVHVLDLADAHIAALEQLQPGQSDALNVGLGRAISVREVIDSCLRVTGRNFDVAVGGRREGDPPLLQCDPSKICRTLDWRPTLTDLDVMVETAWRWRRDHPDGYADNPNKIQTNKGSHR